MYNCKIVSPSLQDGRARGRVRREGVRARPAAGESAVRGERVRRRRRVGAVGALGILRQVSKGGGGGGTAVQRGSHFSLKILNRG